jgi:hypothetical protein
MARRNGQKDGQMNQCCCEMETDERVLVLVFLNFTALATQRATGRLP